MKGQQPRNRSLEKTGRLEPRAEGSPPEVPAPPSTPPQEPSDVVQLRERVEAQFREMAGLRASARELEAALDTLKGDTTARLAEQLEEIKTLNGVLELGSQQLKSAEDSLRQERQSAKQLKAQNLSLQYLLNRWGLPVETADGAAQAAETTGAGRALFFPRLNPRPGDSDPISPVLRGDLSTFCFPDVLSFIANVNLQGVLTVLSDQVISKLYLEKGSLAYVGWNNRDPELSLAELLVESEIFQREDLAPYRTPAEPYDLELATALVEAGHDAQPIRAGLKEHARVILGFLFHVRLGSFFFQPGVIERREKLEFRLSVTDVLLKTAAEMDERSHGVLQAQD